MNYASIIIPFVGGLGMFIYGMQIMAQGLENAAGSRMKSLLEALTKNKLFGVMLGAFITAVIQSSSATTVMVVGFVNAGIMNLSQAMGVIMGANIGTTVTGWLVSSVEWAKFLSPAAFRAYKSPPSSRRRAPRRLTNRGKLILSRCFCALNLVLALLL